MNERVFEELKRSTYKHSFWRSYLDSLSSSRSNAFSVHLAILVEPYLEYIFDGRKTVESRFSLNRVAPFGVVESGDVVLLKRSAVRSVSGICLVRKVWFYRLNSQRLDLIKGDFSSALGVEDSSFWEKRKASRFATLMRIAEVQRLPPIEVPKRDRRSWVVLCNRQQKFHFE